MKKTKILIASFFSLVILTGCKSENNINKNSDISRNNTDLTTSTVINQQENNVNTQNTIPPSTQHLTSSNSETHSQNQTETTISTSSQEQQSSNETTVLNSTDIFESELLPETVQSDTTDLYPEEITKYIDKYSGKEFIIVNVTPNNIYWNELDGYNVTQGQSLDIAIPAIFEDWVRDADGIMIYMSSNTGTFGDLLLNGEKSIKGMTYPQYWSTDYLCPIKDGVICFGEYTDNINNSFSGVDDGVYIGEANYKYSETPFVNKMSISSLDSYFETIKLDHDALMQKIAENPDTDYDIAGFWGYQDGVRFRATINAIY